MNIEIANRLVKLRKENNLSQEALANKLGISRQAVSKWERAEASPDTDNLIALAKLYNISLDDLLNSNQDDFESSKDNTEKKDRVHISLKEGIHVSSKEGEEVHVGWSGIHVDSPKDNHKVDIDSDGVYVDDEKYDYDKWNEYRKDKGWQHFDNKVQFPLALIGIVSYIIYGLYTGSWHPTWIFLLVIPILEGLVLAFKRHNINRFPYPILLLLYVLYNGFYLNMWYPSWIIFFTIPIYYALINYFKKR